jgi:hypothetical protein
MASHPQQILHEARHRELVDQLASELAPVRRLWPIGVRLTLWLLLEALVLAWMLTHTKNNFIAKMHQPSYLLEVVTFVVASIITAAMALRAAIPGRRVGRGELVVAVVMVISGVALLMGQPIRTGYPLSDFISAGLRCAMETVLFALLPWAALWWAVRRGAPTHGTAAGALIGAAALLFSFAVMRLGCRIDDPLHIITWHLMPAVIVVGASTWAGSWWLRLRRSRRLPLHRPS